MSELLRHLQLDVPLHLPEAHVLVLDEGEHRHHDHGELLEEVLRLRQEVGHLRLKVTVGCYSRNTHMYLRIEPRPSSSVGRVRAAMALRT